MKPFKPLAAIAASALLLAPPLATAAGEGHGHEHGEAAASTAGPALPRFAAVSDLFELVGVLKGQQITLYLDRAADNSPVTDAQIELEIGNKQFKATKQGTDEFEVMLTEAPQPGVLPITATVIAGADADLLAGELDIHDAAHADEAVHAHSWTEYAGWAAGGGAVLAILLTIVSRVGRRILASRQTRVGGVT